ncbi:hypothetical protein [Actinacidiphila glaucinigra]|uniref:hypothetical protein n=1 Tax=Actinacidiphila glaucinigra TaxID=235986 RepID=UPI002E3006AF|nr:hypothetical protein [Actinacidiphila glaucinigra]
MKTTMIMRPIANPRRTTLAHLTDAEDTRTAEVAPAVEVAEAVVLPRQTANPRRTVLTELPTA